jgi:hypothetical protein
MACNVDTTLTQACASGIGRVRDQITLLQLIAQLTCEAAAGGGGGGSVTVSDNGTPVVSPASTLNFIGATVADGGGGTADITIPAGTPAAPDTSVQFNNGGAFGGDAGLTYNAGTDALTVAGSVTVPLLASPAATALSLASAGVTRANFSTAGHLLFNTDNTNDIGALAATRPRTVYAATSVVQGAGGGSGGVSIAGGIVSASNISAVSAVSGSTASFTTITGSGVVTGSTLRTSTAFTVGTLPAASAGTRGRRAYVTDATAPTFMGALVGGGAVVTPVFDNGVAWVAG